MINEYIQYMAKAYDKIPETDRPIRQAFKLDQYRKFWKGLKIG